MAIYVHLCQMFGVGMHNMGLLQTSDMPIFLPMPLADNATCTCFFSHLIAENIKGSILCTGPCKCHYGCLTDTVVIFSPSAHMV